MTLAEFVARREPDPHWSGPSKIPWQERAFSRRMLDEHLDQGHDAASRPFPTVDLHVRWIHEFLLRAEPASVLDLCCGPGFYTARLAALGHRCTGIDFSPASIAFANAEKDDRGLDCRYIQGDIRTTDYGHGYRLAMMLFGEFNTFPGFELQTILKRMHDALAPGGRLLLEPQRFDSIQRLGNRAPNWYRTDADLFSDRPHLYLEEHFWDEEAHISTDRYYAVDPDSAEVTEYVSVHQAFTQAELAALLETAGFRDVEFHSSLTGSEETADEDVFVVCAVRP